MTSIRYNSATKATADEDDTIPAATKIIEHDPSTAKDYAAKHNWTFEVIGTTVATPTPTPIKVKVNGNPVVLTSHQ